ncbi:aconitate hydratase 1 [Escherichia coli]|nr:aconitate hydratase 1 [Escherichia coli]
MSSTLREASKDTLQAKDKTYHYYSLPLAAKSLGDITRLPKSLKVCSKTCCAGRMVTRLPKRISTRWQDG